MAKVLMIIAQKDFRDEEYSVPREIMEKAGHTVKVASMTRAKATGKLGMAVQPDMGMHEVNPAYFDLIVIVGGPGALSLAGSREVVSLLEKARLNGKMMAAICIAPVVLAEAGVLSGKNATVFPDRSAIDALRRNGAVYRDQDVVRDGEVITANGPQSADRFGREIVKMLAE